ncbi:MAG: ABC transporter ATP-binding protein [Acidobacteria bacterium]|nr:ABC transporter ATP-binding protein [Acidobacteriota bacterium]
MVKESKKKEILLSASGLTKIYQGRAEAVEVFKGLDLEVGRGEMVAVIGESGSGKSTLLHLLGGLDRPNAGSVKIDQIDITKSTELDLARFRNRQIGFIFQFHHLLPEFSAIENVMMPLLIGGELKQSAQIRALDLLKRIGLGERIEHRPGELSGGEQQRVALARAIARSPQILLADEPTGNLDQRTGDEVRQLIRQLQIEERMSAIIVTHNERLAENCDRILRLENGRLIEL